MDSQIKTESSTMSSVKIGKKVPWIPIAAHLLIILKQTAKLMLQIYSEM